MTAIQPSEGGQSSGGGRGSLPSDGKSLQLALTAARVAQENRGQEIVILDLRELTCIFDYFVIATGTSKRQLHAIADEIDQKLTGELGDRRLGIEGYQGSGWILLDYGNIVIHLFEEDSRDFYGIEKLWGEAKRVSWQEAAP
jgi:ribosome-associated protein